MTQFYEELKEENTPTSRFLAAIMQDPSFWTDLCEFAECLYHLYKDNRMKNLLKGTNISYEQMTQYLIDKGLICKDIFLI